MPDNFRQQYTDEILNENRPWFLHKIMTDEK
jgi:hypothetical protein